MGIVLQSYESVCECDVESVSIAGGVYFLVFSRRFLHDDGDGGEEFERKKTDRAPDAYAHGE